MQRAQDAPAVRAAGMLAELGPEHALAVARYLDEEALAELVAGAEYRAAQLRAATAVAAAGGPARLGPPGALAALVAQEEPQVVAAVLAMLPPEEAAAVSDALVPALRERALARLAALDTWDVAAAGALARALIELCDGCDPGPVRGRDQALALLGRPGAEAEREGVLAAIAQEAPALARALRLALAEEPPGRGGPD